MNLLPNNDELLACVDLVGRTGAKEFTVGYLHDDVPMEEAGWWATATLSGAKITEENHVGPAEAAEALARRILTGAKCRCGKLVALADDAAFAFFDVAMADGTRWTAAEAAKAGQCRWWRDGDKWKRACE